MNAAATPRPPLMLSRLDVERIEELLEQPQFRGLNTDALRGELERAELVEPAKVPADVITMNSTAQVRVEDPELGAHEHELTLVYPRDADGSAHKVSVLAPVGSALLGLSVGQTIDWQASGNRSLRLRVTAIDYQPEASGDLHR